MPSRRRKNTQPSGASTGVLDKSTSIGEGYPRRRRPTQKRKKRDYVQEIDLETAYLDSRYLAIPYRESRHLEIATGLEFEEVSDAEYHRSRTSPSTVSEPGTDEETIAPKEASADRPVSNHSDNARSSAEVPVGDPRGDITMTPPGGDASTIISGKKEHARLVDYFDRPASRSSTQLPRKQCEAGDDVQEADTSKKLTSDSLTALSSHEVLASEIDEQGGGASSADSSDGGRDLELPTDAWAGSDRSSRLELGIDPVIPVTAGSLATLNRADVEAQGCHAGATMEGAENAAKALQSEWNILLPVLVALLTINTAMYAISTDTMFPISTLARRMVAAGGISAALGLSVNVFFLLRKRHVISEVKASTRWRADLKDPKTWPVFFLWLRPRIPALCSAISGSMLLLFIGLVSYGIWPEAVIIICIFVTAVLLVTSAMVSLST